MRSNVQLLVGTYLVIYMVSNSNIYVKILYTKRNSVMSRTNIVNLKFRHRQSTDVCSYGPVTSADHGCNVKVSSDSRVDMLLSVNLKVCLQLNAQNFFSVVTISKYTTDARRSNVLLVIEVYARHHCKLRNHLSPLNFR